MFRPFALLLLAASGALFGANDLLSQQQQQISLTYNKHIAPILAQKCAGCHYENGSAPFKLLTYRDVKKHGDLVETMAILQKMPPMEGDSAYGDLVHYPKLTANETQMISNWVASGMPEGDGQATQAPAARKEWRLGTPDQILEVKGITVPAQGATWKSVSRFKIDEATAHELVAFDIQPNQPWVARQVALAVEDERDSSSFTSTGFNASRLIGFWGLGYNEWQLPAGAGVTLPGGKYLASQMLYHPAGTETDGGYRIGLYFAKGTVTRHPRWVTLGSKDFTVTSEPRWTTLEASLKLDKPSQIISVAPEARKLASQVWLRERANELEATDRETLHIYRWDPRWTGAYNFPLPPVIPAGTSITASIEYDNSNHTDTGLTLDEVRHLPPKPPVHFGPTENDELFWMHVQLLPVKE